MSCHIHNIKNFKFKIHIVNTMEYLSPKNDR